ncbi:MAG: hypothetical protein PHC61_16075, partial [Chitinivibrionales bacterium]|nr:hypothetical protein [Chitinivibrionales bacterium]
MLSIGSCVLGKIPRVVAIIDRPFKKAVLQKCVAEGVDMLEMRADLFAGPFNAVVDYIRNVKQWTS